MDIGSGKGYPASALSNFSAYEFIFDGVKCESMEGLIQSLKFKDVNMQEYVCTLVGRQAKFKGKKKNWWRTQTLWWKGKEIDRHSQEYQDLLDKMYAALATNKKFQKALLATRNATLTHSIGNIDPHHTVLTRQEFTSRLTAIRSLL